MRLPIAVRKMICQSKLSTLHNLCNQKLSQIEKMGLEGIDNLTGFVNYPKFLRLMSKLYCKAGIEFVTFPNSFSPTE